MICGVSDSRHKVLKGRECFDRIKSHISGTIGIMEASEYLVRHSVVAAMTRNRSVCASNPHASSGTHLVEHIEVPSPQFFSTKITENGSKLDWLRCVVSFGESKGPTRSMCVFGLSMF